MTFRNDPEPGQVSDGLIPGRLNWPAFGVIAKSASPAA
jgi:hypothetical protein